MFYTTRFLEDECLELLDGLGIERARAEETSDAILMIRNGMLPFGVYPVGFGVLTVETMAQAIDRAGGKIGNRGRDAARSALEMVHVLRTLSEKSEKEEAVRQLVAEQFHKD